MNTQKSGARRTDDRIAEMLRRYVRDQNAPAAIVVKTSRPLQQRLSSARA